MREYKFQLKQHVEYKDTFYIIIGRAQFIDQENRYMLQDIRSYHTNGFNFLNGQWVEERSIKA